MFENVDGHSRHQIFYNIKVIEFSMKYLMLGFDPPILSSPINFIPTMYLLLTVEKTKIQKKRPRMENKQVNLMIIST